MTAANGPAAPGPEPARDCDRCERLVAFRSANKAAEPCWYNGAVQSFGDAASAELLIVGLAPGLRGANRTGRPFTGDYAGDLLYGTLIDCGLAAGTYGAEIGDGLRLRRCMITNAVRCVPPANKPTAEEIRFCRAFLAARIASLPRLRLILALGRIAHDSTLAAVGQRRAAYPFGHGSRHALANGQVLYDSFHCSRYNTNTGRLTNGMFRSVFDAICAELD